MNAALPDGKSKSLWWLFALYMLFMSVPLSPFPDHVNEIPNLRLYIIMNFALSCFLIIFIALINHKTIFAILFEKKLYFPFVFFLTYLVFSTFFSINMRNSLVRIIPIFNYCALYLFFILLIDKKEKFILYFLYYSFILIILNYYLVIFHPELAIHNSASLVNGEWRGILVHKNNAAPTMAFILFFSLMIWSFNYKLSSLFLLLSSAVFLYMTRGKGPMVSVILTIGAILLFTLIKNSYFRVLIIVSTIAIMAFLTLGSIFIPSLEKFYIAFNIDYSFTGRREVWEFMFDEIDKAPFFGYGFLVFWERAEVLQYLESTYSSMTWANNAHQVYLDIYAQIGIIGFILFINLVIITPLRDILKALKMGQDKRIIYFLAAYWLFELLAGFIDTNMFFGTPSSFNLFMITIFLLRYLAHYKWQPFNTNYQ